MDTNHELVEYLLKTGVLKSPTLVEAFKAIDRKKFVPERFTDEAYEDYPIYLGNESSISQPSTVAFMLELLSPRKGDNILDVGSGSGWTTALLSKAIGDDGRVTGVEIDGEVLEAGRRNLEKFRPKNAEIIRPKDMLGYEGNAPYDRILVSASAENLPKILVNQVKEGGTIVMPIGNSVYRIRKTQEGKLEKEEFYGFEFVPLK